MATATYDATIKKVGKDSLEITITDRFDGGLWLEPTLVIRAMSDALGLGDELYDQDQIGSILQERFLSFEVLQTKKQDGVFRVGLSSDDLGRFSKGETWESYDYGTAHNDFVGIAFSADSKTAITGYHCHELPCASSAAIESVTRKGFGTVKKWLSHPGLVAVGATADGWWTAGGTTVKFWNKTGAKTTAEVDVGATITACSATVVGTQTGALYTLPDLKEIATFDEPIASISEAGTHLGVGTTTQLHVGTVEKLVAVKLPSTPSPVFVSMNDDGRWIAGAGADEAWLGNGEAFETTKIEINESIGFWSIYDLPKTLREDTLFTKSYNSTKIYKVDMTSGDVAEWGEVPFDIGVIELSSGNGQTIVTGAGHPIQQVAVSRDGKLVVHDVGPYKNGFSPSAAPAVSPSGGHTAFACQKDNYRDGFAVVFDAQTGKRVELPNPNTDYDFIQGLGFLDDERLLVTYGNHDAVVWHVTGELLETWSFRAGEIRAFENVLAIRKGDAISTWIDGVEAASVPIASNAYVKGVTRDGTRVLMGQSDSMVVYGIDEEPWQHENSAGGSCLSLNGAWFVRAPKPADYDDPVAGELYDVNERSLVRTFPESTDSQFWVQDDGTVWVMDIEGITIYPIDGGKPRVVKPPKPRDVAQIIVGGVWANGEPEWLLFSRSRVVRGASHSKTFGVIKWGADRRWW